jgi:hypothetical protein
MAAALRALSARSAAHTLPRGLRAAYSFVALDVAGAPTHRYAKFLSQFDAAGGAPRVLVVDARAGTFFADDSVGVEVEGLAGFLGQVARGVVPAQRERRGWAPGGVLGGWKLRLQVWASAVGRRLEGALHAALTSGAARGVLGGLRLHAAPQAVQAGVLAGLAAAAASVAMVAAVLGGVAAARGARGCQRRWAAPKRARAGVLRPPVRGPVPLPSDSSAAGGGSGGGVGGDGLRQRHRL